MAQCGGACRLARCSGHTTPLHMRLHFGAITNSPDFVPDASWRSLRRASSPMFENLLALPFGVVAAAIVAALWFLVTPLRDITPAMSLPAFLLFFAGLVVVHGLRKGSRTILAANGEEWVRCPRRTILARRSPLSDGILLQRWCVWSQHLVTVPSCSICWEICTHPPG